jgi:Na+-driven multidrug efflux pump
MLGMMTGILANIVLDPVFILLLRMGIAGAGLATLLGQAGSCIALILISAREGNVPVSIRRCSLTREHIFHILAGGSPNFTRQGITSLASVLLNHTASVYGETLLASLTIATRVAAIGYMLAIGFGQGFQPICAMNYGAKQYGRVRKALKITVIAGTVMMLAAAAVYAVFAEPLTRLFTANDEVAALGARIIRFQCISLPFFGVYAYASMFLQNTGKYFKALLVSVLRQGIFYVPLLYVLPALFGLDGFLLLQPLADLLSAAIGIWFLLRALREMPAR